MAKKIKVPTTLSAVDKDIKDESIHTKIDQLHALVTDVVASVGEKGPNFNTTFKNSRRPAARILSYNMVRETSYRHDLFTGPVHDLSEVARAVDTESLLARSIQKHREYILKEGWELTGKDTEIVQYVKQRMFEMELSTGKSFNKVLRDIVTNLVTYSTAFVVIVRNAEKSTGSPVQVHGKILEPMCGLFPMDPVSVKVKQNKFGRPIKWRQEIDGMFREFSPEDVIEITIDTKTGFIFGTPYSVTVLDDIRSLRRLEELVEILTHKHLFPFFHVKVGTPEMPAQDVADESGHNISEVDIAKQAIESMPTEGGLVTSERYTIEILGSEGKVLDLQPYLDHFMKRVMSGLRLSGLDLGQADTGNKASAQAVSRNLVDAVKDFQQVIADCLTTQLIDYLVLEGGFDLNLESRVSFKFPTADREEERSQQQHGLTLFQSNAISCQELRRDYMRKEPLTPEEESDTWYERFERPQFEAQLEMKKAAAASKGSSKDAIKKYTSVRVRPQNQYGKSPSKPTFPSNDLVNVIYTNRSLSCLPHIVNNFCSSRAQGLSHEDEADLSTLISKVFSNNNFSLLEKDNIKIKIQCIIDLLNERLYREQNDDTSD